MRVRKEKFQRIAAEIINKNNIISFLDIVSLNITLAPYNILLLYDQDKRMTTVCGEGAWKLFKRDVSEDAKIYQIYLPELDEKDGKICFKYSPMGVVDAKYTRGGSFKPKPSPKKLPDGMVAITRRTIETVSPENIKKPHIGAEFNKEHGVFYLSNRLQTNKKYNALIQAYTDYLLESRGMSDPVLQLAITYILLRQYDLDTSSIKGIAFKELAERENQDHYEFLSNVVMLSREILEQLNLPFMTMEETTLFNYIVKNKGTISNIPEVRTKLVERIKEIEKETEKDDEFMKTILSLKEKLMCCSDSDMLRLLNAIGDDFLPTYPPFEFSVKYTEV